MTPLAPGDIVECVKYAPNAVCRVVTAGYSPHMNGDAVTILEVPGVLFPAAYFRRLEPCTPDFLATIRKGADR